MGELSNTRALENAEEGISGPYQISVTTVTNIEMYFDEVVGAVASADLQSEAEVSGYLVGSTAFKAAETSDPRLVGSIPIHLRHQYQHNGQPNGRFG